LKERAAGRKAAARKAFDSVGGKLEASYWGATEYRHRRCGQVRRSGVFRVRESSLETYLPWLDEQWSVGVRNGAELWRRRTPK